MKILVTGGAGFVGTAVCTAFLSRGDDVVIIDDLSRVGSAKRLEILQGLGADRFVAHLVDITDRPAVEQAFEASAPFDAVVHLAAQVAVTWAMEDPHRDFLVNAAGSFHIADAVRRLSPGARCIYMASNKVYGELDDLGIVPSEDGERLVFRDLPAGVGSDRPLDPVTPYGVSKAAGECYFRDASRTYGLETIVLRASCIYGPKQSQQEDQGWVAWFAKAILRRPPASRIRRRQDHAGHALCGRPSGPDRAHPRRARSTARTHDERGRGSQRRPQPARGHPTAGEGSRATSRT